MVQESYFGKNFPFFQYLFWYYYGPWPPSTFLYKSTLTQQKYCMPRTRFAYHIAYRGVHLHTVELHMHTIFRDQHTNLHIWGFLFFWATSI